MGHEQGRAERGHGWPSTGSMGIEWVGLHPAAPARQVVCHSGKGCAWRGATGRSGRTAAAGCRRPGPTSSPCTSPGFSGLPTRQGAKCRGIPSRHLVSTMGAQREEPGPKAGSWRLRPAAAASATTAAPSGAGVDCREPPSAASGHNSPASGHTGQAAGCSRGGVGHSLLAGRRQTQARAKAKPTNRSTLAQKPCGGRKTQQARGQRLGGQTTGLTRKAKQQNSSWPTCWAPGGRIECQGEKNFDGCRGPGGPPQEAPGTMQGYLRSRGTKVGCS